LNIYIQATLNTTHALIRHTAPVFKTVTDEGIGGYSGNSFVEVPDFNGGEVNLNHIAVGTILWHANPVTDPNHVVAGNLNTGYQA